ncbi:uncharacterized protein L969DRAFT_20101 [Mixia osmundae IAM 14324]|uniref:uncharacterized protein n=1 Tax=Mixia osmundae (strain CBS 9802 / IAM 14324 / JCM 22182 / KY 12970) TaxID=764103 RepID=UPI0004A5579B|nr:uncharacterized protein L969DRAFT_20101 [Mixia osmundae IAM 14324]KEI36710.1 hypothetical protein L969DRAFT_20101 [Mixia osmundae IAM 14324]
MMQTKSKASSKCDGKAAAKEARSQAMDQQSRDALDLTPPPYAVDELTASLREKDTINLKEVAEHTSETSAWIIVENGVYDVTKFLQSHPGGTKILLKARANKGTDATEAFWKYHSKRVLEKTAAKMKIGEVGGEAKL